MSIEPMKIAVLGAGLTGLELGRKLGELGEDFIILEKEPQVGGLCRTNKTGEYYWDFAVHAIYSRSKEAMDFFNSLPLEYQHSDRNVKIFIFGKSKKRYCIEYPFENGVRELPLKEKLECVLGYLAGRITKRKANNLEEWIDNSLGFGIAKYFMVPYNSKIWNCNLSDISLDLVSAKIEPASAIKFIKSVFWEKTVGRKYQSKFIYPRKGIQALCDYITKDIKNNIRLCSSVERLTRQGSKWTIAVSDGGVFEADMIISTIPLVELLKKVDISGIEKEYKELKWNNTFFIMVGLKKGSKFNLINDCHWVFFKGDEIFYRITLMHNFSNEFLPTLVAEVTEKGDILDKTKDEIKNAVVKDLLRIGILGSLNEIAETDIKRVGYTYAIPSVGLNDIKIKIKNLLEKHNLFLVGRNGNWDYINMDGVYLKVRDSLPEILKKVAHP